MIKKALSIAFFSLFFLLSLSAESVKINGNQYRRYIKAIEYSPSNNFGVLAKIYLSDGTKWKFYADESQDSILLDFEQCMKQGKEALLNAEFNSKYYTIKGNDGYIYLISIDKDTLLMKNSFPKLVKEEKILVQEAGWFSSAEYEYHIYLSDSSIWKSKYPTWFEIGDPIIVSLRNFNDLEKWNLINLNGEIKTTSDGTQYDTRIESFYTPINVHFK